MKVAGLKSDASKDFLNGVRQPVEATNGSAQGALQFFTYILGWAGSSNNLKMTLFLISKSGRKCYGICHERGKGQKLGE